MCDFIATYQKLTAKKWFNEDNVKLFLHLVSRANRRDKQWNRLEIKRGEFVTSTRKLSDETELSRQRIRSALDKFVNSGDVQVVTTRNYTKIVICCYDLYRGKNDGSMAIHDNVDSQRKIIESKDNEIDSLKSKVNELESEIEAVKAKANSCVSSKNKEISTLKAIVSEKDIELESRINELKTKDEDVLSRDAEISSLKSKLKTALKDNDSNVDTSRVSYDWKYILSTWNDSFNGSNIKTIVKLTDPRKKSFRSRFKDCKTMDDVKELYDTVIKKIKSSPFLQGDNNRGWSCDFDWILKPTNWQKVLEGNYDNRGSSKPNFELHKTPKDEMIKRVKERFAKQNI